MSPVHTAGGWLYCARCGQAGITTADRPCPTCSITHWLPDHGRIEVGHPETALVRSLAELRGEQSAAEATARILADPYAPDGSPASIARSMLYAWPRTDPPLHVCGANLLSPTAVAGPLRALFGGITLPLGPAAVTIGAGQAGRHADRRHLSPVDTGALVISLGRVAYAGRAQRWSVPAVELLGFQPQQIAPQVMRLLLHTGQATEPHALDVLHDGHSPSAAFYLEWAQARAHDRVADFEHLLDTRLTALKAANADARARYAATSPAYRPGEHACRSPE
ncbi:hypothetical protein ABZ478_26815 [Streptomyces sp. NPDC005706]|uniref:hypothetical protein n=1 Tax=Streptomyces sp. NPDC005706 TaxID=3157169 RepID=UPI0033C7CB04